MAQESVKRTIKKDWSLFDFAREFGKPKLAHCVNHDTGDNFNCVAFVDGDTRTFVAFSSNLGELSAKEIAAQKNDLQVVQFKESGNYCLCKKGDPSKTWEDIDLGI